MGQRSVHQAHTTLVNSVHVGAPCADMFGDSVCAREADDTAAESWYVPLYEGVQIRSTIEGGGDVTNLSPFWEGTARKDPLPWIYLTNPLVK